MMRKLITGITVTVVLSVLVSHVLARPDLTDVWVTTQDYTVLRAGPGQLFDRLTVLPYGTTLKATGRTVDGEWMQVAYEGALTPEAEELDYIEQVRIDGVTYGWVASWLLIWTGDILTLPVDGIPTIDVARRSANRVTIDPETYYYVDGIDPSTRVQQAVTEPIEVELTGRVGNPSGGYIWLQFELNGEYYWTASWEVGTPSDYFRLPDGAYVYSYGRLLIQLRQEANRNGRILSNVRGRWDSLDAGRSVTCNNISEYASLRDRNFQDVDLQREPIYQAAVNAMQDMIASTNAAIDRFSEICNRDEASRFVTPDDVVLGLDEVNEASRNLTVVRTLLTPLEERNPLLGNRP